MLSFIHEHQDGLGLSCESPIEQEELDCQPQDEIWQIAVAQYHQEIQLLEYQIWQNQLSSIFNESNGVPPNILSKLKQMKMGKSSKECPVCFQVFERGEMIIQLPCKHIFHKSCIKPWLKQNKNCPTCRDDVVSHFEKQK